MLVRLSVLLLGLVSCQQLTPPGGLEVQPSTVNSQLAAGARSTVKVQLRNTTTRPLSYEVGFVEPAVVPGPISSWLQLGDDRTGTLAPGASGTVTFTLDCEDGVAGTRAVNVEVRTQPALPTDSSIPVTLTCG